MVEEMNLNTDVEAVNAEASEAVTNNEAVAPAEAAAHEAPKAKKVSEKEARFAAGRQKAKAKRDDRRERLANKESKPKEKLHLTFEEKTEKREAKAAAAQRVTAKAIARYIRMSPLKVNIVLDLIRGKNVDDAMAILQYTPKDAAVVVGKVLKSAVANAENNLEMDRDALYVTECHVGPGPIIKRFQPHAQGRAFSIYKRTSHITVVVAEKA